METELMELGEGYNGDVTFLVNHFCAQASECTGSSIIYALQMNVHFAKAIASTLCEQAPPANR